MRDGRALGRSESGLVASLASVASLVASIASLAGCAGPLAHPSTDARWLEHGRGSVEVAPRAVDDRAPLRVAIYGDTRGNRATHRAVVDAIATGAPDVVVFTGDALECLPVGNMPDLGGWEYALPFWPQVHRGAPWVTLTSLVPFPALVHESVGSAFAPTRDANGWNSFLEDTAPLRLRARVPFLFAPGNHDVYHAHDRAEAARLFGDGQRLYRAVDVDHVRFVVLDTGDDLFADRDPMPVGGAQLAWLESTLADADARAMHVVVAMHMPPFSSAKEDGPVPWVRTRVVEQILDRHHVDLVACGHAHAYERLEVRGRGGRLVTYVVTGGGGAPFHHGDARDPGSVAFAAATAHYVRVEIGARRMHVQMVPVLLPNEVPASDAAPDDVTIEL